MRNKLLVFFCFCSLLSYSAISKLNFIASDSLNIWEINPVRSNILPVHPLANFSLRNLNNFKFEPEKITFLVSLSNGNVWLPNTKTYYPTNRYQLDSLAQLPWHYRFNDGIESENEELDVDGLIRTLNVKFGFALNKKHELQFNMRSLFFEAGRRPFTFFNSDKFIEDFHEHVYGGDDPFARKVYGLDQTKFYYKQKDEDELILKKNQFIIPGFEISYFYYPQNKKLKNRNISVNLGQTIGFNTTHFNKSLDYAISVSVLKGFVLNKKKAINLGLGSTGYYHQILKDVNASHIYNSNVNWTAEGNIEYKWETKKGNRLHSISLDFYIQSSYTRGYRDEDYEGLIFEGNRYTSHWHTTATHLFQPLQAWSFSYSYYLRKVILSIYLQEDLKVNNAPDTQTGIGFKYIF